MTGLRLHQLAQLHCQLLPSSILTRLGPGYLRHFYRFLGRSAHEDLVVETDATGVTGAAVLSYAPHTLARRLLLNTPMVVWAFRIVVERLTRGAGGAPAAQWLQLPELFIIFTRPDCARQGLGRRLVAECEKRLRAKGVPVYSVKTEDDPANPALKFYDALGFTPCDHFRSHGLSYVLLSKQL
jgi:ribosomal protein S18 acetylase RimI-like enzyme